jgi:hypothetical protein
MSSLPTSGVPLNPKPIEFGEPLEAVPLPLPSAEGERYTAAEVAEMYSPAAEWIPLVGALPPAEMVRVLYADGVVADAQRAGKIFLTGGMYQYVTPMFWQPIKADSAKGGGK